MKPAKVAIIYSWLGIILKSLHISWYFWHKTKVIVKLQSTLWFLMTITMHKLYDCHYKTSAIIFSMLILRLAKQDSQQRFPVKIVYIWLVNSFGCQFASQVHWMNLGEVWNVLEQNGLDWISWGSESSLSPGNQRWQLEIHSKLAIQ